MGKVLIQRKIYTYEVCEFFEIPFQVNYTLFTSEHSLYNNISNGASNGCQPIALNMNGRKECVEQ